MFSASLVVRNAASRMSSSRVLLRAAASRRSDVATAMAKQASALPVASSLSGVVRNFSDGGSHDDFAPKKKEIKNTDEEEIMAMIQEHVTGNPIMLYMKGSPSAPQCGFSAKVIGMLQKEGVDFASVNVLDYPSIRDGVKKFSQWPTIPQLYVDGEFIGGCDIVTSMHESGELTDLLKDMVKKTE
eukprot:scaffold136509_cov44-Attheya_sp.AAC.2